MHKNITISVLLLATMSATAATDPELDFVLDNRRPFHYYNEQGELIGQAIGVVRCAMKSLDYNANYSVTSWKRAQKLVETKDADAFFAASQNATRDQYATLSRIISDQYWSWFVRSDAPIKPDHKQFKERAYIISWAGSNSGKWLHKNYYKTNKFSNEISSLVDRLLLKRADAAFVSNIALYPYIQHHIDNRTVEEYKEIHKPMGVYFGNHFLNENPGFLEKFNLAVEKCQL